jgi:hypothetical protein
MAKKSILSKTYIQRLLIESYQNMCWHIEIEPRLVMQTKTGETSPLLLQIPQDAKAKHMYMYAVGVTFAEVIGMPTAALLISDSWYVDASKAPQAMSIPPSQHPARQNAIIVAGRTADNLVHSMVVHPYTIEQCRVVFDKTAHEVYEEKRGIEDTSSSILDAFFEGARTYKK